MNQSKYIKESVAVSLKTEKGKTDKNGNMVIASVERQVVRVVQPK